MSRQGENDLNCGHVPHCDNVIDGACRQDPSVVGELHANEVGSAGPTELDHVKAVPAGRGGRVPQQKLARRQRENLVAAGNESLPVETLHLRFVLSSISRDEIILIAQIFVPSYINLEHLLMSLPCFL